MERHSFRTVSGESPETMRKLCLSKFPHQEIRWNYDIFRSAYFKRFQEFFDVYSHCADFIIKIPGSIIYR